VRDEKSKQRRKILLGLAGGAAVPAMWSKPLVKSVVLPAHATTSEILVDMPMPVTFFGTDLTRTIVFQPDSSRDKSWYVKAMNNIVPVASAQSGQSRDFAVTVDGGSAEVVFRNGPNTEEFSGTLMTDGSPGTLSWSGGCNNRDGDRPARVVNYTDGDAIIVIEVLGGELTWQVSVPEGPISPFPAFGACLEPE